MQPEIRVDDDDANRRIAALAVALSDLRSFWPLVVPIATSWWSRQFQSEGAFASGGWAALSPAYRAWKQRHYPGKPILQRTGAMKRAVSKPTRYATPTSLVLVVEDPKLGYHQDGAGRLPARPVIFGDPLPAQAAAELEQAAVTYVGDLLGRF